MTAAAPAASAPAAGGASGADACAGQRTTMLAQLLARRPPSRWLPQHQLLLVVTVLVSVASAHAAEYFLCSPSDSLVARDLLLLLVFLAASVYCIYFLLDAGVHFIPECVATILIGSLVGLGIRIFGLHSSLPTVMSLNPNMFLVFLLPAIIFEAGYGIHVQHFFTNIGGILMFAVVGTIISTVVIAAGMSWMAHSWLPNTGLSGVDCLLFGALISAVDPVATLAIFSSLNVNPTLHMLVFGESVVNDAVAIVLYRTFEQYKDPSVKFTGMSIFSMTGSFLYVSLVPTAIGLVSSLLAALFFKYSGVRRYANVEVSFMIFFSYMPYLLSEALELSGIMCVLTSGIFMAVYAKPNLSPLGNSVFREIARTFSFLSETMVFMYLGLAVFIFRHHLDFIVCAWAIALCIFGRMLNIFPLTLILNPFRHVKISFKNQVIMCFAGLRGAIAFALSIDMLEEDPENNRLIFTTTIVIALFTIATMGGGTLPLLRFFRVQLGTEPDMSKLDRARHEVEGEDERVQYWNQVWAVRDRARVSKFALLNQKYFEKWFIRATPSILPPQQLVALQAQIRAQAHASVHITPDSSPNTSSTSSPSMTSQSDSSDSHLMASSSSATVEFSASASTTALRGSSSSAPGGFDDNFSGDLNGANSIDSRGVIVDDHSLSLDDQEQLSAALRRIISLPSGRQVLERASQQCVRRGNIPERGPAAFSSP